MRKRKGTGKDNLLKIKQNQTSPTKDGLYSIYCYRDRSDEVNKMDYKYRTSSTRLSNRRTLKPKQLTSAKKVFATMESWWKSNLVFVRTVDEKCYYFQWMVENLYN